MYHVVATGSTGNAVVYNNEILVDCGVPFTKIRPFLSRLKIVLLSHEHKDHLNIKTIQRMAFERPSLRFACGKFLADKLEPVRNVDILEPGVMYDYGRFKISPVRLYHDVKNYGYRIFINGKKIFHATDSAHLDGIKARNYDLYAIEANYDEDTVDETILRKISHGGYAHQIGAINSHLSIQQAQGFILNNAGEHYGFLPLHQSVEF